MKTSERLLNASKTIWDAYNEHPFVLGIQNGTLERDKFRYYIMQDFLYLKDYAKTYAVGVAKAKSVETANLFAKYSGLLSERTHLDLSVSTFAANWKASRQVPERPL